VKRSLLAVLCVVILGGCGASYRTEYRLTPPADPSGLACVQRCAAQQTTCKRRLDAAVEDDYQLCEVKAREESLQCQVSGRPCQQDVCYRQDADDDACGGPFRECYQACGGTVRAEQVCASGCR
jgi:hypothetical protein